jgi:hypothetical protein
VGQGQSRLARSHQRHAPRVLPQTRKTVTHQTALANSGKRDTGNCA